MIRLIMVVSRLLFSYIRTNRRAMKRLVSMPPWAVACLFMRRFPAASWTFAWLFTRLPDENSSGHGRDSSAELLQMDETEGDMITCRPSSLAMLLVYMSASLQPPPSHWPSPPYDDFISSGLRSLYRCSLRGLPIAPARRGNGSCKWVRSWNYKSIVESRPWSHLRTWLISTCRSSQFGSWQIRLRRG